jgi:hypothetical protein
MDTTRYDTIQQSGRHPTKTTDAYRFISTREVLDAFAELGWHPTQVKEAGVRDEKNRGFQKHIVRLQNADFDRRLINVGDAVPQIVLANSHSGESSFRLFGGILEKICGNGLVIERLAEGIRIPHIGYSRWLVEAAASHLGLELPEAFRQRERWQKIVLSLDERLAFAEAAIALRYSGKFEVEPTDLLRARRYQQADNSLWSVLNTVQEGMMRGGIRQNRSDGSTFRSRHLRSVDDELRINTALWRLAVELEKALVN